MKKILSVLLATLMVLSSLTLLVGATEPVTPTPGINTTTGLNSGHIFYQENFDDEALATLTNDELAAAIGWNELGSTHKMSIQEGQLRIETAAQNGEDYVTTLVTDEQIKGNAITIEYKFTYLDKADKNLDAYLSVNFRKDAQNALLATPVTMNGTVDVSKMCIVGGSASAMGHQAISQTFESFVGKQHVLRCVVDPGSDGVIVTIDGMPITGMTYTGSKGERYNWRFTNADKLIHDTMELLVQPGLDVLIDDLCISEYAAALQITEVMANAASGGQYQYIEIHNPNTTSVNVYDFCVVVNNSAYHTEYTIGSETDKYTGVTTTYQTDKETGAIHAVQTKTYSAWEKHGGSVIGYFQPGAMKIMVDNTKTREDQRYQIFDNPAYEDGVLEPGETAVVLLPYTAITGGTDVTDEAFRAYMNKLGAPEDTKIFACNNKVSACKCAYPNIACTDLETCPTAYQFPMYMINSTSESMQVGLMRVNNLSTDGGYEPEAIGYGQSNAYRYTYFENYVVLCSKPATSGSIVAGFDVFFESTVQDTSQPLGTKFYQYDENGIPVRDAEGNHLYTELTEYPTTTQRVLNGVFGSTQASLSSADDHSFEITYNQSDDPSKTQKMGYMCYNSVAPRPGNFASETCNSPGTVPAKCRNGFSITANDPEGNTLSFVAYDGADYEYNLATPYGYSFVGMYLNGDTTELVDTIPGDQIYAGTTLTVEFVYQRLAPTMVGYQQSAMSGGTYSMRLLAVTNHVKCQSLGFKIEMSWTDAEGELVTKTFNRECFFVYDSVTWDDGTGPKVTTAADLGGEKLYAYQLDGIPETQENITVTVTPYYIKGSSDLVPKYSTDSVITFVLNDQPVYDVGDYETDKDNTDFTYDNSAS